MLLGHSTGSPYNNNQCCLNWLTIFLGPWKTQDTKLGCLINPHVRGGDPGEHVQPHVTGLTGVYALSKQTEDALSSLTLRSSCTGSNLWCLKPSTVWESTEADDEWFHLTDLIHLIGHDHFVGTVFLTFCQKSIHFQNQFSTGDIWDI